MLLGPDAKRTILDAFETHAATLTCHTDGPTAPPPVASPVSDAEAFHALIRQFHAGRYTVRIPAITNLSPNLALLARALEVVLKAPVDVAAFWSREGAGAPVHYDEYDLMVIQLVGKKRWFVSADPPGLNTPWKRIGEGPPPLDRYRTVDLAPGDFLYLPRGTPHTVQSTTESIHLAIGFVPVTVRDAIIAVIDHLSDLDRTLREGATERADDLARGEAHALLATRVRQGVERLFAICRSDSFIKEALEHRTSRMIGKLPKLPRPSSQPALTRESRVRHSPLATAHLIATPNNLDFSQPGGHTLVHLGAEESLRFIASTPEFSIADIPGEIGDDVRVALAASLVASGFLELAGAADPSTVASLPDARSSPPTTASLVVGRDDSAAAATGHA
jgi:hypothetical protein